MQGALHLSRRQSLQGLIVLGAGAALSGIARPSPVLAQDISDEGRFSALRSTSNIWRLNTTSAAPPEWASTQPMPVRNPATSLVESKSRSRRPPSREFVQEVAENELAHVRFYRKTLGTNAVDRPAIDFGAGFKAVAEAAGLGPDFDPFGDETNFVLGGMLFEDVGVTAYAGAATVLKNKDFLAAAAGILAVEAYHMGMARSAIPKGRGSLEGRQRCLRCPRQNRRIRQ